MSYEYNRINAVRRLSILSLAQEVKVDLFGELFHNHNFKKDDSMIYDFKIAS